LVDLLVICYIFPSFAEYFREKSGNPEINPIPWRDSITRPIAPVSLVAGGDDTTGPRRQGC
jgi:hypothetical protein